MRNLSDIGRRKGYLSLLERMKSCFEGDIYSGVGLSDIERVKEDASGKRTRPLGETLAYIEAPDLIIEPVYMGDEFGCFSLADDTVPEGVKALWSRRPTESCADYNDITEFSEVGRAFLRDVFLQILRKRDMPRIIDISRYSPGESPPQRILRLLE